MNEEAWAWTVIGVVALVAIAAVTIVGILVVPAADVARWEACIEAGRQMVNGVCL